MEAVNLLASVLICPRSKRQARRMTLDYVRRYTSNVDRFGTFTEIK
jgi:hypothetical protein